MQDLAVIDKPDLAQVVLDPVRNRILRALRQPGSATTVAKDLGLTRQKVNYHLRTLEDHGLIHLIEERPRRGLTERIMQASAESYVLSPATLGEITPKPERTDRLSSRYLIALAARLVSEVADLTQAAAAANKPLATLSIDSEIKFANAADRAAFSQELNQAVVDLAARYHHEEAPNGRWHRLIVAAHPKPNQDNDPKPKKDPAP